MPTSTSTIVEFVNSWKGSLANRAAWVVSLNDFLYFLIQPLVWRQAAANHVITSDLYAWIVKILLNFTFQDRFSCLRCLDFLWPNSIWWCARSHLGASRFIECSEAFNCTIQGLNTFLMILFFASRSSYWRHLSRTVSTGSSWRKWCVNYLIHNLLMVYLSYSQL